jgi:hypothetical protein
MEVPENSSTLGFQEYMVDVMNKGSLSLMLSIGHRVGLFDTMVSLPHQQVNKLQLLQT